MRTIIAFIEPLGLAWLSLTAAMAWLMWRRHFRPAVLVAVPWFCLTLVTCTPVPSLLLASLEKPWADLDFTKLPLADAVVSLGGTGEPTARELVGFHLTRGADRVMTAVELVRLGKADELVFGGGGYWRAGDWASEADAVKRWIDSWQVIKKPVISLGLCADTHDEALKTAALINERGWKSVILVTSASHMRRAEATFKKAGVNVVCVRSNFVSTVFREDSLDWFHAPHPGGAEAFHMWLHETLGWLAYRWRGWV